MSISSCLRSYEILEYIAINFTVIEDHISSSGASFSAASAFVVIPVSIPVM